VKRAVSHQQLAQQRKAKALALAIAG